MDLAPGGHVLGDGFLWFLRLLRLECRELAVRIAENLCARLKSELIAHGLAIGQVQPFDFLFRFIGRQLLRNFLIFLLGRQRHLVTFHLHKAGPDA